MTTSAGTPSIDRWNILSGGDIVGTVASGGSKEYLIKDHLGSTRTIVNTSGSAVSYYDYYPFGKLMAGRHTWTNDDRYKFTGHELDTDADLDLSYAGARYLDSEIGGWLSIDPMEEFASSYSYVGGNPLNFNDPTGMASEAISAYIDLDLNTGDRRLVVEPGDTWFDVFFVARLAGIELTANQIDDLSDGAGNPNPGSSTELSRMNIIVVGGTPPLPGGIPKNPKSGISAWKWVKNLFAKKSVEKLIQAQKVPNLNGKNFSTAKKILEKYGFNYKGQTRGGYDKFYHTDGSKVFIRPNGEVTRSLPSRIFGKGYRADPKTGEAVRGTIEKHSFVEKIIKG